MSRFVPKKRRMERPGSVKIEGIAKSDNKTKNVHKIILNSNVLFKYSSITANTFISLVF